MDLQEAIIKTREDYQKLERQNEEKEVQRFGRLDFDL